jgi:hypothetical protein
MHARLLAAAIALNEELYAKAQTWTKFGSLGDRVRLHGAELLIKTVGR